jgi:hypothetical protein
MKYIIHYIFNCIIRVRERLQIQISRSLVESLDDVWDKIKINRAKGNRAIKN